MAAQIEFPSSEVPGLAGRVAEVDQELDGLEAAARWDCPLAGCPSANISCNSCWIWNGPSTAAFRSNGASARGQRSRVRLMADSLKMFSNLFMVRWNDLQGRYN